jgi:hypothetical protein
MGRWEILTTITIAKLCKKAATTFLSTGLLRVRYLISLAMDEMGYVIHRYFRLPLPSAGCRVEP